MLSKGQEYDHENERERIQVVVNQKKKECREHLSTAWTGINVEIEITSNNQVLTCCGKRGQDILKLSKKTVSEPGGRYRLRIVKRYVPEPVATVQQIASMLDWWGRLICEKDKASEINSPTPPLGRPWRGTCKKLKPGGARSDRKAEVSLALSQVLVTARMSSDLLTIKSWSNGPFSRAERTLIEPILKSWSGVVVKWCSREVV